MARDEYPDEVELVRSIDGATDTQKRAAEIINEHWGTSFNKLEESIDDAYRTTLERTRDKYFGPKGTNITFGEIKDIDEFDGKVKNWMQAQRRGTLQENGWPKEPEVDREEIYEEIKEQTKNELYEEVYEEVKDEVYEEAYEEGMQEGRVQGIQEGWLRLDNALLNVLDSETYKEIRNAIDESSEKRL